MFIIGKPATNEHFFDRIKMLKEVKNLITQHQDFMIKAPRRYGKTSLVKQALIKSKEPVLYLDLRRVPRLELLAQQVLDFAYAQAGIKGFFKKLKTNAVAFLLEHKQIVNIDLEYFEYSVEFFAKEQKPCEMLLEALETAHNISVKLNKRFIIILDEFQDVNRFQCEDIDILEALRGVMQHHETITYGFLGSIEHLMTMIFENKKSPFYNFCRKIKLTPFDIDELFGELIEAFRKRKIVFHDEQDLKDILHKLSGHPTNTMLVMQNIHYKSLEMSLKTMTKEIIAEAYEDAYFESNDLMDQYINEIKGKKHYYDVLYRLINHEQQQLKGSALNQVYKGLVDIGYLTHISRGEYHVNDGFFSEYIRRSADDT